MGLYADARPRVALIGSSGGSTGTLGHGGGALALISAVEHALKARGLALGAVQVRPASVWRGTQPQT